MTKKLDSILEDISERLANAESVREASIASSRKVIRLSKNTIHAIHSKEDCSATRKEMREIVSMMDKESHASKDAMMEYAEAEILYAIVNYEELPTPADLGIDEGSWLMGMADTIGELRRIVVTHLMDTNIDEAKYLFSIMDELCEGLLVFDVPDSILPIRRKQDIARGIIERTRSDLLNASITFGR